MSNQERRTFQSERYQVETKQRRKDRQKANKRKGFPQGGDDDDDDEQDDGPWTNFSQDDWWQYQREESQRQKGKGRGRGRYSAAASSSPWRPKYRRVYTSVCRR